MNLAARQKHAEHPSHVTSPSVSSFRRNSATHSVEEDNGKKRRTKQQHKGKMEKMKYVRRLRTRVNAYTSTTSKSIYIPVSLSHNAVLVLPSRAFCQLMEEWKRCFGWYGS